VSQPHTDDAALTSSAYDVDREDASDVTLARPAAHPLGPWFAFHAASHPARARLWSCLVLTVCAALLSVAVWLKPDPSGLGTHRQLGLPACTAVMLTGYPCPTCGMTTAFAHAVRGQLVAAFVAQPAGLLLALATMVAGILSVFALLTGYVPQINWYRISPTWVVLIGVAVILLGWLFKLAWGRTTGSLPIR